MRLAGCAFPTCIRPCSNISPSPSLSVSGSFIRIHLSCNLHSILDQYPLLQILSSLRGAVLYDFYCCASEEQQQPSRSCLLRCASSHMYLPCRVQRKQRRRGGGEVKGSYFSATPSSLHSFCLSLTKPVAVLTFLLRLEAVNFAGSACNPLSFPSLLFPSLSPLGHN